MEVTMTKTIQGYLCPCGPEAEEWVKKIKPGAIVRCDVKRMRNGQFFRKWWSLVKLAFDLAEERMRPVMHKGEQIKPSFDRFRQDITILAGYYEATVRYDGSLLLQARSLRWSEMNEEDFEKLYSATIDVVLSKIINHTSMTKDEVERAVDMALAYA